jgi:diguanylate cyclase (GGDEF)-like protein
LAPGERIEATVRRVEARQWWLWCSAMVVTALSMLGIASFVLPAFFSEFTSLGAFFSNDAVRGLLSLVLIFNVYVVYEQLQINRVRKQVADEFYRLAFFDPLTGLFNRRYVEQWLGNEIVRSHRRGSALIVVLFDLDGFKEVNDVYGHYAGDRVLKEFAERLRKATRGADLASRYGGDEFLAVLSECTAREVRSILERLDDLQTEVYGQNVRFCYSVGWAECVAGDSIEHLLKRADQMLYANKRGSRSRVFDNKHFLLNGQLSQEKG